MELANFNLAGWPLKEWGAVLDIRSGRNQRDVLDDNGNFPIIGSAGKVMGYANNYICDEGTTVLGRKGTIDNPLYFEQKFWNVDTAFGLVAGSELDKKFLYYFCLSVDFTKLDKGTTLPSLVKKDLVKVLMPIPSFFEQKRIVAILDQAFVDIEQSRAKTEQNLKNTRELFESYLDSYFNPLKSKHWERVKIESACISIIDCINKTAPKVDYKTDYKMIRTTNVRHGLVNLEKVNYVSEDIYAKWTRRQVPEFGDVILTREAPMGEVGMLLSDEKVFLGQRLVSYRANPEVINRDFLLYAFQSKDVQEQIASRASGSTVQHMRVPDTKILEIPLPSLDEQKAIVEKLKFVRDMTVKLSGTYSAKLESLDELKKSILQKAFSGELTKAVY